MRWYFVPRKWWWDCHWLPAEGYVEKQLKVKWKKEIETKIWIDKFVEACRQSVMKVNENWKRFVSHVGRWVDMDRAYFTMDIDFMESVMWVFSTMYKNNLIYKSFKIQWYCPNCATPLSAYEISQGYKDKQDKAITVKFRIKQSQPILDDIADNENYLKTEDGFIYVVGGVVKKDNKYFLLYHPETNLWTAPGGKVEKWETLEDALKRELREELWVDIKINWKLWGFKKVIKNRAFLINYFEVDLIWEPEIKEPNKHTKFAWVEVIPSDNELGFSVKVDGIIIDDPSRIKKEFIDIYILEYVFKKIDSNILEKAPVYFLAWTTTPWTLPSNMFLAVNPDIDYVLVFDLNSKEYYVLAKALLKRYYKKPNDYIEIFSVKWRELVGLRYRPLFDYYLKAPNIPEVYKANVFKVLPGDFVSTDSWTGIVHIAPAFGEDDWNVVTNNYRQSKKQSQIMTNNLLTYEECKLPADWWVSSCDNDNLFTPQTARDWLFLPLNEYAEFTDLVPDYKGFQVFEANEKIIDDLKKKGLVVKVESITHSYPHCRRCKTPLIYRAVDSRFINVNKLKDKLLEEAEDIYFVPESVKNRFKKWIEAAPDWNISRNRYWWAPLPIWEEVWIGLKRSEEGEGQKRSEEVWKNDMTIVERINQMNLQYSFYDEENRRIIVWCLDDLYKLTKTGSKNITRLVLQRHGETDYNVKHLADSLWKATLTENWEKQAEKISDEYFDLLKEDIINNDFVIVVSPLQRTFQTITPFVKKLITDNLYQESQIIDFDMIKNRYYKVVKLYQYLWENYVEDLIDILKWNKAIEDINDEQVRSIIEDIKDSWIEIISSNIFRLSSVIPIYVDFRITDHITPSVQDKPFDCHTIKFDDTPISNDPKWESALDVFNRVKKAAVYWTKNNSWKTVILVSHWDPIVMIRKALRNFDRKKRKYDFYPSRGQYVVHYINTDLTKDSILKEVDLHRPYVDSHWFKIWNAKFERITEILDCWFESGSMPYWQDHYPF
jgi:broad specificity phosphatase PhoE/ADP-ribose pyrophosphatase YjhB (NUDIX family)